MHSALCTSQTDSAAAAIGAGDAVICCTQEQRLFEEIAGEIGAPSPAFLDLRDRAGWTADEGDLLPKMSALVAEAALDTS
ncbi:MAG: (4Fe-4S)-binding protein, partial [Pseudomonadota bacterium]|nr:(4Fe-4S)-binding protein [Pseudomonadota bacterium]